SADDLAVLFHHHAAGDQIDLARRDRVVTEHEQAAGGVISDCVLNSDLPVLDARIDDLEARHHTFCGGQHIGVGHARAGQILFQDEGDFSFGAGLHQLFTDRHGFAAVVNHGVGQITEVRLVHIDHVLHCLAGDSDLLADHPLTIIQPVLLHALGYMVGVFYAVVEATAVVGADCFTLEHGLVKLVAELVDLGLIHGQCAPEALSASLRKSSTSRAKRPACSIWVQWPQWPNTCNWALGISSASCSDACSGIT